jgi:multidrug efflux pump subunit AcrB
MWIVRLALRNPYSVAVLAAVLMLMGALGAATMMVDVFPVIDLPVVSVIWNYPGLSAEEMESRVTIINERAFSTTVQGISRIESQSFPGIGNLRVYFEPGTEIGNAVAQITAVCQTILRILPPGMTPPMVLPFNASNVPVAQLTIENPSLSPQALFDYALNFLRIRLFTIRGLALPAPYGGAQREINIDVNPLLAASKGVSLEDVSSALQSSNVIEPAGIARIGKLEYNILTNSSPKSIDDFERFPIKIVNGREVRLNEVAKVADGFADQTNLVRINGRRAVYLNILKKSNASTISVIDAVRQMLPKVKDDAPKGTTMKVDFDQSKFVRASVKGVLSEALIAALLVSAMVLAFLGSWRSVIIVCTSIPLSIFASLIGLKLSGDSINVMTLGGLALSIGMLVDDATVEVENINRNRPLSDNITAAALRGAHQIALPAIVTTLAICIVFFPIVLLTGPAKYLFVPLAKSVVYAMIASYILSRTLVPVLARILLRNAPMEHAEGQKRKEGAPDYDTSTKLGRFSKKYNEAREKYLGKLRESYGKVLGGFLQWPFVSLGVFGIVLLISATLPFFVIGRDFFPSTDVGILKLHFRAPSGTRIEETESIITKVEEHIRKLIPASELETIDADIGVPLYYNLGFVPTDNSASMDAEVLIALKEKHKPSEDYRKAIRKDFADSFPGSVIYFQSADIVSQVLNFGLAAPIDLQVESKNANVAYEVAKKLRDKVQRIVGAEDVVIRQVMDYPALRLDIDRERAGQLGLTERDASGNLLYALTGSGLVAPNYYINPQNNVNYQVVTKAPIPDVSSVDDLLNVPVTAGGGQISQQLGILPTDLYPAPGVQTVGNIARVQPTATISQINHVDVQNVMDILANVEGRDLGGVVGEVRKAIQSLGKLPEGVRINLRGQNEVMESSFTKLGLGMILAAVLVYLLMVTLFQSWLDPVVIMMAVPGSLCGVVWALAATNTTLNVESLMGTIMAIGIAVSNSNLLVNFANDFRVEGGENKDGHEAALEAGKVRLRPVLMTALAMVLGMLPMALGLSDAGAQNAPLGRAVIGGLIFSTGVTLFLVPVTYAVLRKGKPTKHEIRTLYMKEEKPFDDELRKETERDLQSA